jgi:hypothetical protein
MLALQGAFSALPGSYIMRQRWLAILVLIAGLGLVTPGLMADHGDHGWDRDKGNPHKHFKGEEHGRRGDRDDDRWEHRGRYEYRTYGDRDGRPPGWVRGRKAGWGYCGLPPAQARKYGCYTYVHEGRRYYYYQDDVGRIIVRRPVIAIHAGVDIVQ